MPVDRRLPPVHRCPSVGAALPRVALALLFTWLGARAGMGYGHMCVAGSGWIEGGAILGTPLATWMGVLFARRLWLACAGAGVLVLLVAVLQQPYLEWAHRGMRW